MMAMMELFGNQRVSAAPVDLRPNQGRCAHQTQYVY